MAIHDMKTPWYRLYRYKLWHKFTFRGQLTDEQLNWLTENIGQYNKKWMYDTKMDNDSFAIILEMMDNTARFLAQDLVFPTRLFFKRGDDKLHFMLRWA